MPLGKGIAVDEGNVHAPTETRQMRLEHIEPLKGEGVELHLHHPVHDGPSSLRLEYPVLAEERAVHPGNPRLIENQVSHIPGHKRPSGAVFGRSQLRMLTEQAGYAGTDLVEVQRREVVRLPPLRVITRTSGAVEPSR